MYPQSQNGHHEMPTLYMRRRKPSNSSRPFPPGFTPVTPEFPCTPQLIKNSDSGPIFLPPTLRSPLPPTTGSLPLEKQPARPDLLAEMPSLPQASQRTPSRLFPSIKRIYSAPRPSHHSPSHSIPGTKLAFPIQGHSDHIDSHNGAAVPNTMVTRLRSLSQHSHIISKPKLSDLVPSCLTESSMEQTGRHRDNRTLSQTRPGAKSGLPRTRCVSNNHSTPRVGRDSYPFLESRPEGKPNGNMNVKRSCPTGEPSIPRMKQLGRSASSGSDVSDELETIAGVDLKKLPHRILDNWTGWRMEILTGSCNSLSSDKTSFSKPAS